MTWRYYHTVWAVMVFTWITNYSVRVGLAPALIPIMKEFNLTYAQGGLLATAFFYAYTMMQLPAGYLGDRLGKKTIIVLATAWWGLMSLFTGFTRSFPMLFMARFLTGVGQGSLFSNDRPIIAAYTPREKMGMGQGISFIGLGIGMTLGILFAGMITDSFGWRYIFIFYSIPSFLAALLVFVKIKEPQARAVSPGSERKVPYRLVFTSPDLWLFSLAGIAAIYCLWVLGVWAPAMFKEIGVKELAESSVYSSLLGIAAIPGLILTGMVTDALVKRGMGRKVVIAAEFVAIAVLMALIGLAVSMRASALTLSVLVFVAGLFLWGIWAPAYALLPDIVPREILGTAYGLINTIHFLGSLFAPWVTGKIKDMTGSFAGGAYVAAGFIFLAAIILMAMRPAYRLGPEVPIGEKV